MKLSSNEIDRYRNELSGLSERAGLYVSGQLLSFMEENPKASVAEIRKWAKEIIENALGIYGDQAATMAADFFEEVMEAEGVAVSSQIYDEIDRDQMDEKIRYFARDLVEGSFAGFVLNASDVTKYYVKRQAYENMVRNCYENDVRYARVPTGKETCGYCFMLCSRGFVYHSEASAKGKSNHGMHRHCDCIIVPGVKGVTKIQGYDPESMGDRWDQCRKTCGSNKQRDIIRECETRDWRWLYTGKEPEYEVMKNAKPNNEEKETASRLAKNGYKSIFRATRDVESLKTSDTFIVMGQGETSRFVEYEYKNPKGNGKQTIFHQLEEGAGQSKRIVIDLAHSGDKYDDKDFAEEKAIKFIRYSYKIKTGKKKGEEWQYEEIVLLHKDGTVKKIRR